MKLTESTLHRIVKESLEKLLNQTEQSNVDEELVQTLKDILKESPFSSNIYLKVHEHDDSDWHFEKGSVSYVFFVCHSPRYHAPRLCIFHGYSWGDNFDIYDYKGDSGIIRRQSKDDVINYVRTFLNVDTNDEI